MTCLRRALAAALAMTPVLGAGAERPAPSFEDILPSLRLSRADLGVRAERWPTRMKLPAVESLLSDPLALPGSLEGWERRLGSGSPGVWADLAADLLGESALEASSGPAREVLEAWERPGPQENLAPPLRAAIGKLLAALALARPDLEAAVSSLEPAERSRVLEAMRAAALGEEARLSSEEFALMERFDLRSLLSASARVLRALEEARPALRAGAASAALPARTRLSLPLGDVLLSGGGEDEYSESDLRGVVLLVDFGGASRYRGPAAAAGEGELRLFVDLSPEVSVESASGAASGIFGIGLLDLAGEGGRKTLEAGDFSLGAGLFGTGGLFIADGAASLRGGRFTQGAGAFGLGMLDSRGEGASYSLRVAGQGFGSTRGAGLFRHRGDGASLDGGLSEPDAREPLAALSLSQGAGYGPRAYAAGGAGLALVEGAGCRLRASYLAQGMGYWHSLGGLVVRGRGGSIVGRRYVQGAGVHTALGAFLLRGDDNALSTWGVGPGFGWDYGIGALDSAGDGNSFASDWASGRGDVNGHGLVSIRGRGNRIALADAGSGALKRGAPSFGLVEVSGEGNAFRLSASSGAAGPLTLASDPWGALRGDGGLLVEGELPLPKPDWPAVPREKEALRERERLGALLREAQGKPLLERLKDWLYVASSAGFDPRSGMEAGARLVSLPQNERRHLVRLLSADDFSGFLWLRLVLASFGRDMAATALAEYQGAQGMRRALLLGLFGQMPVSDALGPALLESQSADWRMRRQAALVLGRLFDRGRGQEPGRLRLLETASFLCSHPEERAKDEAPWRRGLGEQGLAELFAALSLGEGMAPAERAALLSANANPFEPASPAALSEFARILGSREKAYAAAISAELEELSAQEAEARKTLKALLGDADPEVAAASLAALGGIGREGDAPLLSGFLEHPSGLLREAAASALGRMGRAARKALRKALRSRLPRTRALAAVAAARSGESAGLLELKPAFRDEDEEVRRTALAALLAVQEPLRFERAAFAEEVSRLLRDPSPSVRAAARRAFLELPRP